MSLQGHNKISLESLRAIDELGELGYIKVISTLIIYNDGVESRGVDSEMKSSRYLQLPENVNLRRARRAVRVMREEIGSRKEVNPTSRILSLSNVATCVTKASGET